MIRLGSNDEQEDTLPADCASCGYHLANKECRRHAPHPGHDEDFLVAVWNYTQDHNRCGSGTTIKKPVACNDCIHWHQPNGEPLWPDYRPEGDEWWQQSGYCTSGAPGATVQEGLWTFWKVTSAYARNGVAGGCGDGVSITAMQEAAEKKAAAQQASDEKKRKRTPAMLNGD